MYALSGDCAFESITIALKGITVSWVWMKNDDNSEQNDFSRENGLWFENRKLFTGTLVYGPPAGFPNGFIKAKIKNGLREGLVEIFSSNERVWKKNNYKHCTKLGLFNASIQLKFVSTTELQNTIILYIINIFSKEVLLEM